MAHNTHNDDTATNDQPSEEPTNETTDKSIDQLVNLSVDQPTNEPNKEPTDQLKPNGATAQNQGPATEADSDVSEGEAESAEHTEELGRILIKEKDLNAKELDFQHCK